MKVWITRYALTAGILEVDAKISEGMASFRRTPDGYIEYVHGKDWHETQESALIRAGEMKIAKLQSLEKQIRKVSKITFEVIKP